MYISTKNRAYRKDFYETKYTSFLIKVDELLENIMKFGKKLKISSKKEFHSEPVYNKRYLK